jgi:acyl dehydratase
MRDGSATADSLLFFEDFEPGRVFELGARALSEEEVIAFAAQWDPQDMHLNRSRSGDGKPPSVIASGWLTACVWMRLYVDAVLSRAAMLSAPGIEELRWLRPVRPGMRLHGRATIVEAWRPEGATDRGTMRLRGELLEDDGTPVMTMIGLGRARIRRVEEGRWP